MKLMSMVGSKWDIYRSLTIGHHIQACEDSYNDNKFTFVWINVLFLFSEKIIIVWLKKLAGYGLAACHEWR